MFPEVGRWPSVLATIRADRHIPSNVESRILLWPAVVYVLVLWTDARLLDAKKRREPLEQVFSGETQFNP